ncbi:hypothetical protein Sjap_014785 [Stephania japonica]|uniref:Uncharacterized protein n=1 Tax=Stephania japonica TaxID=461633 RepID=A0AAP0NQS4_9MAGN
MHAPSPDHNIRADGEFHKKKKKDFDPSFDRTPSQRHQPTPPILATPFSSP